MLLSTGRRRVRDAACSSPGDRGAVVGDPVAHQVSEIVTRVEVTAHRRMRVRCDCGECTLAELAAGVPAGAFGPGIAATAATLTAGRVGRRETVRIFSDLFGLQISTASLQSLLEQTATALEDPYLEILRALDTEPVRGADETLAASRAGPAAVGLPKRSDGVVSDRDASRS